MLRRVYQWKSQLPQDGIFFHHQHLSEAIQILRQSVAKRKGLTQRTTQFSPVEEEAFMYDVEKCLFSAEVIMSVTTSTVYENVQSPMPQMPSELPGTPAEDFLMDAQIPKKLGRSNMDPPRLVIPEPGSQTPDTESQSSARERSPVPPIRSLKPTHQKHIAHAIRPKASNPSLPKSSPIVEKPNLIVDKPTPPGEKPIMFHLDDINAKHRGSFDSDCDSDFDPEPESEDRLPDAVYSEMIIGLREEVQRAMQIGDYQKAEQSHRKAIDYLTDREKKLGLPFENKTEMNEILADIYIKRNELSKAKQVLNRLLMQEKEDTPRKWRLYHVLAEIYQDQDRLAEAEKFAKRAYIGRERSLEKDDRFLLQSVSLLASVYERQHKTETAEALRRVYRAESVRPQVPPKSRQRSREVSQSTVKSQATVKTPTLGHTSPPPYSQPHSPSLSADDAFKIGKTQVRWAPDAWVDSSSINAPTKSGETPLIAAINTGDEELVRLMLQRGADIETRCVDQIAPLMHAVSHGFQSIVEILLANGAQVDSTTAGWTALHRAADMVNLPIAKLLLIAGADMEARSPKQYIPKKHPLARMNSADLDEYDEVDASEADMGWTALSRASLHGHEPTVRLLVDQNADIEARSPSNGTPLTCAAEGNHEAIVDFLLMRGANVNTEDEFGWKPLHRALVNRGGERVAQMLLTHGAQLDARDNYRKTPLHHGVEKGNDGMVAFLLQAGADYEARDIAERTPLQTAIDSRRENMVRILLEAGADADAKDRGGRDALAAATHALRKSPEIIALLAKNKKDRKVKRGSVGSRQTSVSGSSSTGGGGVVQRSGSSGWWSRGRKEKK